LSQISLNSNRVGTRRYYRSVWDIVVGVETVRTDVPAPVSRETLLGFRAIVTFVALGESVAFRLTLPAKPFKLPSETVNVANPP